MSETPVERQTVVNKHGGEPLGSVAAGARGSGSRSLQAGGEFLKALGADLGAVASRLRPEPRSPQPPPSRTSSGSGVGRVLWRVGMVFLGVLLLCSGAISAAMLWVIFGSPLEPRHGDPGAPRLQAEANNSASPSGKGTGTAAGPSRPDVGPMAEAPIPPASLASAAEPEKSAEATKLEAQAGSNQPQSVGTATQDHPGGARQQSSEMAADQQPGMRCSADLCAATYKSFNAADCTYQPNGGGSRRICELGAQAAVAHPPPSHSTPDPSPNAMNAQPIAAMQPAAKSAAPDMAGPQCNRALCAATYRSFDAADCTYEPYGGGPRSICGLTKGPADTPQQMLRAPMDSGDAPPEPDDVPVARMMQDVAEPVAPDEAGSQCNRSRCAAMYRSFHAGDCTYQPEGGGPRRLCEP